MLAEKNYIIIIYNLYNILFEERCYIIYCISVIKFPFLWNWNGRKKLHTLNDEACIGRSLSCGTDELTGIHHIRIISRGFSDRKSRHTLGYLDVVLYRLGDLSAGHKPRRTWCLCVFAIFIITVKIILKIITVIVITKGLLFNHFKKSYNYLQTRPTRPIVSRPNY